MGWRWLLPALLPILPMTLGSASASAAAPAPKTVGLIDRVIAVVNFDCILLSDVRTRARPFVARLDAAGATTPAARAAAEAQIHREVLERMIDERLIAAEADRSKISVTTSDVDAAMQSVASSQGLTIPKLLEAAKTSGLSEKEYRDELRRQLLEGKVLQLRVIPRIKDYAILGEAAKAQRLEVERRKYTQELREAAYVDVRL